MNCRKRSPLCNKGRYQFQGRLKMQETRIWHMWAYKLESPSPSPESQVQYSVAIAYRTKYQCTIILATSTMCKSENIDQLHVHCKLSQTLRHPTRTEVSQFSPRKLSSRNCGSCYHFPHMQPLFLL